MPNYIYSITLGLIAVGQIRADRKNKLEVNKEDAANIIGVM
jgi:hypothetical protein